MKEPLCDWGVLPGQAFEAPYCVQAHDGWAEVDRSETEAPILYSCSGGFALILCLSRCRFLILNAALRRRRWRLNTQAHTTLCSTSCATQCAHTSCLKLFSVLTFFIMPPTCSYRSDAPRHRFYTRKSTNYTLQMDKLKRPANTNAHHFFPASYGSSSPTIEATSTLLIPATCLMHTTSFIRTASHRH